MITKNKIKNIFKSTDYSDLIDYVKKDKFNIDDLRDYIYNYIDTIQMMYYKDSMQYLINVKHKNNIRQAIIKKIYIKDNKLIIFFSDSKTYNIKNVFNLQDITLIDGGFIENINKTTYIK